MRASMERAALWPDSGPDVGVGASSLEPFFAELLLSLAGAFLCRFGHGFCVEFGVASASTTGFFFNHCQSVLAEEP